MNAFSEGWTYTEHFDRDEVFAEVKASHVYATRYSPERLARLPKIPRTAKYVTGGIISAISVLGLSAILIGAFGSSGFFAAFGGITFGVSCIGWFRLITSIYKYEAAHIVAIPAIAVEIRKEVRIGGGNARHAGFVRTYDIWYATFEDEQGQHREYELFSVATERHATLSSRLMAGDAGVLYARGNVAFDFEKNC